MQNPIKLIGTRIADAIDPFGPMKPAPKPKKK